MSEEPSSTIQHLTFYNNPMEHLSCLIDKAVFLVLFTFFTTDIHLFWLLAEAYILT